MVRNTVPLLARRRAFPILAKLLNPSSEELAEREGFEPPCRLLGKTLSRRPRYDHFGTSPLFGARGRRFAPVASGCSLRLASFRSRFVGCSIPLAFCARGPLPAPLRSPG